MLVARAANAFTLPGSRLRRRLGRILNDHDGVARTQHFESTSKSTRLLTTTQCGAHMSAWLTGARVLVLRRGTHLQVALPHADKKVAEVAHAHIGHGTRLGR